MSPAALDPLAWVVLLPLAWGAAGIVGGGRFARASAPAALAASLAVALLLAWRVLADGPQRLVVGGWAPPLGIALHADGLGATMVAMSAAVALAAGAGARGSPGPAAREARFFWPLVALLMAGMNALFLSDDLFNLYVALELMGLSAVGLVALQGSVAALAAALRYLVVALVGSIAYLMAVALLYARYGTLALPALGERMAADPVSIAAIALAVAGLALKTALFPLHAWLPPAHGSATAPVSALLSAVVVKGSFCVLLRLWFDGFDRAITSAAAQGLGVLGAAAVVWGGLLALRQQRLKQVVGYLFRVFPLAAAASAAADPAWSGAVYHAVAHGFAKGAMFLAAGALVAASADDRIASLAGVSQRAPVGLFAFAIAAVSIMGLPPSGGFIAKWMMLRASVASGQWWWALVLVGGGLLSAAYLFRVLRCAFVSGAAASTGEPRAAAPAAAAAGALEFAALGLALGALGLGLAPAVPLRLLQVGAPFGGGAP